MPFFHRTFCMQFKFALLGLFGSILPLLVANYAI